MAGENLDLFGNPSRPGKGQRGRPPYEATEKDRNRVKLLLALGWSATRIANALDVSLATVKRYFRAELKARDAMRDRLDARRIEVAAEQAFAGNVSAMRTLNVMIERSDTMRADQAARRHPAQADDDEPTEKLGKKQLNERAAEEAERQLAMRYGGAGGPH